MKRILSLLSLLFLGLAPAYGQPFDQKEYELSWEITNPKGELRRELTVAFSQSQSLRVVQRIFYGKFSVRTERWITDWKGHAKYRVHEGLGLVSRLNYRASAPTPLVGRYDPTDNCLSYTLYDNRKRKRVKFLRREELRGEKAAVLEIGNRHGKALVWYSLERGCLILEAKATDFAGRVHSRQTLVQVRAAPRRHLFRISGEYERLDPVNYYGRMFTHEKMNNPWPLAERQGRSEMKEFGYKEFNIPDRLSVDCCKK